MLRNRWKVLFFGQIPVRQKQFGQLYENIEELLVHYQRQCDKVCRLIRRFLETNQAQETNPDQKLLKSYKQVLMNRMSDYVSMQFDAMMIGFPTPIPLKEIEGTISAHLGRIDALVEDDSDASSVASQSRAGAGSPPLDGLEVFPRPPTPAQNIVSRAQGSPSFPEFHSPPRLAARENNEAPNPFDGLEDLPIGSPPSSRSSSYLLEGEGGSSPLARFTIESEEEDDSDEEDFDAEQIPRPNSPDDLFEIDLGGESEVAAQPNQSSTIPAPIGIRKSPSVMKALVN